MIRRSFRPRIAIAPISDPGPGEHGGEIVFFGPIAELANARGSLTADYLFRRKRVEIPRVAAGGDGSPAALAAAGVLRLRGAAEHNLKNIDAEIPLRRLVCVTGVSGSGKSTLVHDILYPALLRAKGKPTENPGRHRALEGDALIDDVVMVDQSRIGRTTRSNPASYVGAFDAIRDLFARLPQARERKYTAGTFSFNAGNGRCPGCGGNGFEHVEMQFLSDVYLRCPDCDGRRYRPEVLEVKLSRGKAPPKSIADVLDLTVSEALAFFSADAEVSLRCVWRRSRTWGSEPICAWVNPCRRCPEARHNASSWRGTWRKMPCVYIPPKKRRPKTWDAPPPMARRASGSHSRARCFCSTNRPPGCTSTTFVAKLLRAFRRLIDEQATR